jgi:hypothetical protein
MVHNSCETPKTVIRDDVQFISMVFGKFHSKTTELAMTVSTMTVFWMGMYILTQSSSIF